MHRFSVIAACILIGVTSAYAQFDGDMKPDVTFGDHNDRYNLDEMTRHANRYFARSQNYRRNLLDDVQGWLRTIGRSQPNVQKVANAVSNIIFGKSTENPNKISYKTDEDERMDGDDKDDSRVSDESNRRIFNSRRAMQINRKGIKNSREKIRNYALRMLSRIKGLRRDNGDEFSNFAMQDDLKEDGGIEEDYDRNLMNFNRPDKPDEVYRRKLEAYVDKLHDINDEDLKTRRNGAVAIDPVDEVLLHNAVPIKLKISGYLQEID